MARRYTITIVLAVLSFLNGIALLQTDPWWGATFVLLGVLLFARYFSRSVREFAERHRIPGLTLLIVVSGVLGVRYYIVGNLVFALTFWLCAGFAGIVVALEIWAIRTFPDLDW